MPSETPGSVIGPPRPNPCSFSIAPLEPFEGPHITLAGGGGLDPQHRRGFQVAQLLEVAEGQHLAIGRLEAVEGGPELVHRLGPLGRLAGRGQVAHELGDLLRAGGQRPARVERDLPAGVPICAPRCWRWTSTSRCIVTQRSQIKNGMPSVAW